MNRLVTCIIAALSTVNAAIQNPARFSATSRIVEVGVVVTDRGRPVPGLHAADFELLDEGKPQVFQFTAVHDSAAKRARALEAGSRRLTNRGELPSAVTAILFDQLNTSALDQARAKRQLIDYLARADMQQPVALYVLGRSVRALHDFTSDPHTLSSALAQTRARPASLGAASGPESAGYNRSGLAEWVDEMGESLSELEIHDRVVRTLAALESIGHNLVGVPGRKNLVWISGSFPFSMDTEARQKRDEVRPPSYGPELERCARIFSAANIAVYPVEARGLAGDVRYDAGVRLRSRRVVDSSGARVSDAQDRQMALLRQSQATLHMLAVRTGGEAFTNTNDIGTAVSAAFGASGATYILAFQPTHGEWDGRFRKLQVRVKRRGLTIRHRAGYLALPDATETRAQRDSALRNVLASPLEARGVPLEVEANATEGGRLRLALACEPAAGPLDFLFVQQNAVGEVVGAATETVRLDAAPGELVSFQKDLTLAAGTRKLRVIVRDPLTGLTGSVTVPL